MLLRETQFEQSVFDYVKQRLADRGYGSGQIVMRDAFPTPVERSSALSKTTVAIGFSYDDGGRLVEMGSDLTYRIYTVEFWTFGINATWGRTVAQHIRNIFEADYLIPLKDVGTAGQPVIDQLQVAGERGVRVERQIAPEPRPWDSYVWSTTVRIEDFYSPSLVQ